MTGAFEKASPGLRTVRNVAWIVKIVARIAARYDVNPDIKNSFFFSIFKHRVADVSLSIIAALAARHFMIILEKSERTTNWKKKNNTIGWNLCQR